MFVKLQTGRVSDLQLPLCAVQSWPANICQKSQKHSENVGIVPVLILSIVENGPYFNQSSTTLGVQNCTYVLFKYMGCLTSTAGAFRIIVSTRMQKYSLEFCARQQIMLAVYWQSLLFSLI